MTDPLRLAERYQSIADMPGDLFDFPPDAEQRQRFRLLAAALRLAAHLSECHDGCTEIGCDLGAETFRKLAAFNRAAREDR